MPKRMARLPEGKLVVPELAGAEFTPSVTITPASELALAPIKYKCVVVLP
ncbi:hypothetical protein SAMN05216227_11051 [Pseudorhodobacter antarcticus]|uniref:Uncharacterized protein n=1 Tax=Pseudorhodobacter antarcticus TaxID=1077947 RepID=A0A1H8NW49_9RHOB|nr:hypothetical protein SAMN05216227_11051 [Pseudorhodobacter antarcticus]